MLPRAAVGAVVLHNGKVLLVQRGKPPRIGKWAIPGGSVEAGETLCQAAERELREETGIEARAGEVVHVFELIEGSGDEPPFHYIIIDLMMAYLGGEPTAAEDAREARWFDAEELSQYDVDPETLYLLRDKLGMLTIS